MASVRSRVIGAAVDVRLCMMGGCWARPGRGTSEPLTLTASAAPPDDEELRTNWLPAPDGQFSLYLRAYWPEQPILDGTWSPPPVTRFR